MRATCLALALACLALLAPPLAAQEPETGSPPDMPESLTDQSGQRFDPGGGMRTGEAVESFVDGEAVPTYPMTQMESGFFVPNGQGGYVWVGEPMDMPRPSNEAAVELKLKVRELADQLFSTRSNDDLRGLIALPVSFVSQDDFQKSSSFGRYIAEQMYYELNQRGFPVREYRLGLELATREGGPADTGEFLLSRRTGSMIAAQQEATVALVGTYYFDRGNVFVNARLIDISTGMVMRTGLVLVQQNPVIRRMLASGVQLESSAVRVDDFSRQTQGAPLNAIDMGYDVH